MPPDEKTSAPNFNNLSLSTTSHNIMTPVADIHNTVCSSKRARLSLPFGEYLFKRLQQIHKVKSIFGVPGDFNLPLLEHIYTTDLNWVGGCNELNAGYTADGYSRYTKSLGVLITTYGVGELSALNAISGAFAENSKVLHIVGIPFLKQINDTEEKKKHLHHLIPDIDSFKDSDRFVYTKMVEKVSCISRVVMDPSEATQALDDVIEQIFTKSRPGYLFLPCDMSEYEVDASRLYDVPANFHLMGDFNPTLTEQLANEIISRIYKASKTSILADVLVDRYSQGTEMLREFVEKTKFSNYTTFMGKSILDESQDSFVADYNGVESNNGVKENLESSELVLYFGPHINEINCGHYSFDFTEDQLVLLHPDYVKIGGNVYTGTNFINVLAEMLRKIDVSKIQEQTALPCEISPRYPDLPTPKNLSQSHLLKTFEQFLKDDDVLVCETGSFMFGVPDLRFPKNLRYISQGFYLSIGAALPMSVGVGIAMRDEGSKSRLILVEGDGSAQMTYQEMSAFPYYGLKPIIFLLNNSGYTVERIIKGESRSYNDIKPWNWTKTFELFDFEGTKSVTKQISTESELNKALLTLDSGKINFMEVILDEMDCPWRFHHMNGYRHFPIPLNN